MSRKVYSSSKDVKSIPWWKTAVFYQIYVRSFADSNGDGIGDLPGIIQKLDYLNDGTPNSLGVNAIWLTPFYESPNVDFGYDVSNHHSVHPEQGTMDDFATLIDEAHKRGIKVIVDFVGTLTSNQHAWFQESRKNRLSPKRDWYIWRNGRGKKRPNNWQAVSGGNAWEYDIRTDQYFYHAFFDNQPHLNWSNPEVAEAMLGEMRFWLERGADGFRFDLINHLMVDMNMPDNPFSAKGWYMGKFQVPKYTRDLPQTHELIQKFRNLLNEYPDKMMVGETVSFPWEESQSVTYTNDQELHLAFNMEFFSTLFNAKKFRHVVDSFESRMAEDGWPAYTLSNHDIPRHLGRYGGYLIYGQRSCAIDRAKICAAMLLTLKGTPFMYYGEEIGMTNRWLSKKTMQDPMGKKWWPIYQGRDACRTPMLWKPGFGAGFTTGEPWLPIDPAADKLNVETSSQNSDSLLNFYKKLIWLRNGTPALQSGEYEPLTVKDTRLYSYRRYTSDQSLIVMLNFSNDNIEVANPKDGKVFFSSDPNRKNAGVSFTLAPYEALILQE